MPFAAFATRDCGSSCVDIPPLCGQGMFTIHFDDGETQKFRLPDTDVRHNAPIVDLLDTLNLIKKYALAPAPASI
eukprot:2793012-Rhodomonas_salina.2